MMIDDSYFMDYIKHLGKGPDTTTTTKKKAGPRRLALAQPQKSGFIEIPDGWGSVSRRDSPIGEIGSQWVF